MILYRIKDHQDEFLAASKKDMGKPDMEVFMGETVFGQNDVLYVLNHLDAWTKDEKDHSLPLTMFALSAKVRKEPYGSVLIIGYVSCLLLTAWPSLTV